LHPARHDNNHRALAAFVGHLTWPTLDSGFAAFQAGDKTGLSWDWTVGCEGTEVGMYPGRCPVRAGLGGKLEVNSSSTLMAT
jgi:hypothetical protein